jgi:hypothetical protein
MIILTVFGAIIRAPYTFLVTKWSIEEQNILKSICTSLDNSSSVVFSTQSIFLLKSKLKISSPKLWHHLVFLLG